MTEVKPKSPCKLCGGKAIIAPAGPGKGYFLFCENSAPERDTCTQSGRIVPGWALDAAELWDKLNGPGLVHADFATIEHHILGSWAPAGPLKEVRRAIEAALEWTGAQVPTSVQDGAEGFRIRENLRLALAHLPKE